MTTPLLLDVPTDGRLVLSPEQLKEAGFKPGDRLVLTTTKPGYLFLQKAAALPQGEDLRELLQQLIQESFREHGYADREEVITMIREVRQEMANDQ